ncbi:MAG: hypothetical protein GY807_24880 [Gammaproteobacteria bacterium]|nr:hypothetical protein [Gammaproteobacteria bacterium]
MEHSKHTPGPWKANENTTQASLTINVGGFDITATANRNMPPPEEPMWANDIATLYASGSDRPGEARANAYLIAAAPDLLKACLSLPDFDLEQPDAADFKDHASEFIAAMRQAREAIAKAQRNNQ